MGGSSSSRSGLLGAGDRCGRVIRVSAERERLEHDGGGGGGEGRVAARLGLADAARLSRQLAPLARVGEVYRCGGGRPVHTGIRFLAFFTGTVE